MGRVGRHGIQILALGLALTACTSETPVEHDSAARKTVEDTDSNPLATALPEGPGVTRATPEHLSNFLDVNRGRPVVINFWATWCAPCIHEMPDLAAFYDETKDSVGFLSINTDQASDIDTKVIPYATDEQIPFRIFSVASLEPDELSAALQLNTDFALPTTLLLDATGAIVTIWPRNIEKRELDEAIAPLLAERIKDVEPLTQP